MHIAYISAYYKPANIYGGPTTAISSLCEQLVKERAVLLEVYTTNANGKEYLDVPLMQKIDVEGVPITYFPLTKYFQHGFFSPPLIHALLRKIQNYDLLIIDGIWTLNAAILTRLAYAKRIPYILPLHGQLMPWAMNQKRVKKYIFMTFFGRYSLSHASGIHCASQIEADNLEGYIKQLPIFVLQYGINTDRYITLPPKGYLHTLFNIADNNPIIVFLGRLHPVKMPEIALYSWARSIIKDSHLVYIGPDETNLKDSLLHWASDQKCVDRVHFTGLLQPSDVIAALSDADLFFLPSIMESLSIATIEAMISGLPLLLSDKVPLGNIAAQAGAARLITGGVGDYTSAIDGLFKRPEKLKTMGEQGRKLAFEIFDIKKVSTQFLNECNTICSEKPFHYRSSRASVS